MKIITITTNISMQSLQEREKIKQAAEFNQQAQIVLKNKDMKYKQLEYPQGLSKIEVINEIQILE
ncbi:MAG: hypothetical protein V7K40_30755 [Nostoc sp.]|uniref:hypothetical protein n=1 Tax=Nostoc sp. TaxID=1180 RepID=UPI002FF73F17